MRNFILSMLFAVFCLQGYAQQYIPMPMSDVISVHNMYNKGTPGYFQVKFQLMMNGEDTVVNAKTYKKIILRYKSDDGVYYNPVVDSPDHYYAGIREEDKKVYITFSEYNTRVSGYALWAGDTVEDKLLYDFNLTVGDTAPNFDMRYGFNNMPAVVTAIDSVQIGNSYHKRFKLSEGADMIEGIGSSQGLLYYGSIMYSQAGFICLTHQGTTYQPNPQLACDYLWPNTYTSINNEPPKNRLQIYPNPFSDELTVDCDEPATCIIRSALGQTALSLQTRKGQNLINTSALPSGMYHVVLRNVAGETLKQDKLIKQ